MMERLGPVWMGGCILAAIVFAVLANLGLRAIATPTDFAQRNLALERRVRQIEQMAALPGDGSAYPKGAVCDSLDGDALPRLRQALEEAAAAEGLQHLQIAWGAAADAGAKIVPVPLRIEAEGPYDRLLSMLDRAGRATPRVFVDSVDLTAGGPGAHLTLSGKVFCWTRG